MEIEKNNITNSEVDSIVDEYNNQSAGDADRHSYSEFSHSDYSDSGCC